MGLVRADDRRVTSIRPAVPPPGEISADLSHPDPAVRRQAVRRAAASAGSALLVPRLRVESDAAVRAQLLTSLADVGDEPALECLVECLRSEDASLRNGAVDALGTVQDALVPRLGRLLADPDPDVRVLAIAALQPLRHPAVESWLIAVIRDDAEVNVCAAAVEALSERGSPEALAPLAALAQRFAGEPFIPFAVDAAADRIRSAGGPRP